MQVDLFFVHGWCWRGRRLGLGDEVAGVEVHDEQHKASGDDEQQCVLSPEAGHDLSFRES